MGCAWRWHAIHSHCLRSSTAHLSHSHRRLPLASRRHPNQAAAPSVCLADARVCKSPQTPSATHRRCRRQAAIISTVSCCRQRAAAMAWHRPTSRMVYCPKSPWHHVARALHRVGSPRWTTCTTTSPPASSCWMQLLVVTNRTLGALPAPLRCLKPRCACPATTPSST